MENRKEILNDYFELTRKLNLSNRTKNEFTELSFMIKTETGNIVYLIVTTNHEKYLRIGQLIRTNDLKINVNFQYQAFAEYLKIQLKVENQDTLLTIRLAINRLFSV